MSVNTFMLLVVPFVECIQSSNTGHYPDTKELINVIVLTPANVVETYNWGIIVRDI